jgi:transcriptional regulator with XRE-family HTH domain
MLTVHTKREDLSTLGNRLRKARKDKGWTQEQLAAKADTSQAVIQKIENGKSLRPRKIDKIAEVLDVSAAWLQFGTDGPDGPDDEAMELARLWASLDEPYRSTLKEAILEAAGYGVHESMDLLRHHHRY